MSDHLRELANQIHIVDDHGGQRDETERECGWRSRGGNYLSIGLVVERAGLDVQVDRAEDAQMKQIVALAEEVELAGKVALRKVGGEEERAQQKQKNVTEMMPVVDGQRRVRVRPEVGEEQRQDGEAPEATAWHKLQEAFNKRIWPLEVGLRNRVEQDAQGALETNQRQEIRLEHAIIPQGTHERYLHHG